MTICIDASLVVALLMPESLSPAALSRWQAWVEQDEEVVAPALLRYEVHSALYRKAFRELIAFEDSLGAIEQFTRLDIHFLDPPGLPRRAAELAKLFERPNTYDAHYLALAEHLNCPFWSADERLYNAVCQRFANLYWLGQTG
jgi:predicted nucleic acid-binding protein